MTGRARQWRRRALRGAAAALLLAVTACLGWEGALRWIPYRTPPRRPAAATIVEDAAGKDLAAFISSEDTWCFPLKSEELSPWLKKAIVAVEDRRFYDHGGIDWQSVIGAAWADATHLHVVRGASTLTMQVQRLRDPRARTWWNKADQAFRAAQLDRRESKDALLAEYLNAAPFGGNVVGAGAAAWRYFGKRCADLSLAQAALLAGLPQSPNRLRPDRHPEAAIERRHLVLLAMRGTGAISAQQFAVADGEPVDARWLPLPQRENQRAYGALPALAGLKATHPGERVRTTLDPRVQPAAYALAKAQVAALAPSGIDSAAVVVIDVPTGRLLGTVSISQRADAVDLTRARRSTGSTLKPFIYAAAFDEGVLSPQDKLTDAPKSWTGYVPVNFDREFHGTMSAADALAQSRNIPAMTLLAKTGEDAALAAMSAAGVRSPGRSNRAYGLALAIGGAEASPLELAEGYATLARGGQHLGLSLLPGDPREARRALPEEVAGETLACLADPARTRAVDGGGAAAALGAAWKTGTSSDLKDAWCAAVTPRIAVVVWLGNAGGQASPALVGVEAAAPLALQILGAVDSAPPGAAWQLATAGGPVKVLSPQRERLAVVSPREGQNIYLEGPTRVLLKASGGTGPTRWWFANGALLATTPAALPATWQPTPGTYTLRLVDNAGAASTVQVRVR